MKTIKPTEIAKICDVHHRTVSRWIASGELKGHKLPGRGNYRVVLTDFIAFLQRQNMPIPAELKQEVKVLVVDDEPNVRNAIRRTLTRAGISVLTASDGFEAGILLEKERPQFITVDLSMPGLNGFDLIDMIRAAPEYENVKIIVISGLSELELQRAKDKGAMACLSKPFSNEDLLKLVESS